MKSAPPANISLVFNMPVEIATVARFLASDDAKWVSGEAVLVAGGHRGLMDEEQVR
jgi:hypothetical protein